MRNHRYLNKRLPKFALLLVLTFALNSCKQPVKEVRKEVVGNDGKPEYFQLRPEIETAYGYTHAVKIGNVIKISGAVSMDSEGNPTAVGDLAQQMKNCYADLEKILNNFGCTFDDVVEENIFTTDMALFLENAGYRNSIYTNRFPTGSWLGVNELALPELMIEIELEAHKAD
jgi:enamine deaminase RidA (YjgF/YER057c/UK114 family)